MLYDMALDNKNHGSEYWLGLAKDAAKEENVRQQDQDKGRGTKQSSGVVGTDDEASSDGNDDSHLEQSQDAQPTRKRARNTESPRPTRRTTVPPRPLPLLAGMESPVTARSSTAATMASTDGGARVKFENGEGDNMITVYIGKQNTIFKIPREELSQSPVLSGYVRGKSFVMDPDLMDVKATLFDAVDEFLKTAEFQPFYVPKEGRADFEPGAGRLDGVNAHTEYAAQLLRLGKLYVMAGKFGISKMQLLIRQKTIAGFPDGWSYKTMLEFVRQIFRDIPGTVENAAASPDRSEGVDTNDPLKEWLIMWLAEYMREYSQSLEKGVPKQYWDTLDKGVGLSLAVHRVKIQIIEKHKGELVKLEDDGRTDA